MKILILLVLCWFGYTGFVCSQEMQPLTTELIRVLDSISTQDVRGNTPGIATCIIRNGKVIYKKCAGLANLDDSSPITGQTRFNLASNGKQFTALAILQLVQEKKLSLADDIRRYIPGLFPGIKDTIAVENLLTHTSGIRDVYDLLSLQGITWWKKSLSNDDVLTIIKKQKELNFRPGTQYLYSNSNYILLAEIIGKIRKTTFSQYSRTMFARFQMNQSSFESNATEIRGPVASPYFNFDTWTKYNWIWNAYGDGNFFSTLDDQITWEKNLQQEKGSLLPASVIRDLKKPIGKDSMSYGYGLEFGRYRGENYTFHEGATGAWKTTVLRFPKYNLSLLTLTNSGKVIPAMQTRQMADVILGWSNEQPSYRTTPLVSGNFISEAELTGIYQTSGSFTFQLEKRDSSLFLIRSGRNDTRLVREAGNIFHQWNDAAFKQEFKKNATGEMELTAYYTSHAPYTLVRPEIDWTGFQYDMLNGTYTNDETDAVLSVRHIALREYEIQFAGQKRKGVLVTPTRMIVDNYVLEIPKPGRGSISALLLNGDRIKNVKFRNQ